MFCTARKFPELECAARDESPTGSEIQRRLGTSLAQLLLDRSHREAVKLQLDPTPRAKLTRQSSCCASRDGELKADATETWARRQETLRSFLHSDILALGEGELEIFQAEIEAATERKLRDEFTEEYRVLEAEKRFVVRRNAEEIHAKYEEYLKSAQEELEKKLRVEVSVTDEKCEKELRKAVVKAGTDATRDVLRKIRPQIDLVVTSLYNELEQTHRAQREKMIVEFNEIVRKQQLKQDARIREIERVKMEELRVQRHEFEIRNVANIICIVCMERLRGSLQLQATHEHFQEKIKSLHELVAKQEETVNVMEARITKYRNENKVLKEKIDALSEEFQKFINFAFNTLPEHADFLLPLDLLSINSTNKEDKQEKKRQIN